MFLPKSSIVFMHSSSSSTSPIFLACTNVPVAAPWDTHLVNQEKVDYGVKGCHTLCPSDGDDCSSNFVLQQIGRGSIYGSLLDQ